MPTPISARSALRVALLGAALALPDAAHAQLSPARVQLALPPSTWRLTLTGEILPSEAVQRQVGAPRDRMTTAANRLNLRLSAPVWKRGLYRTVIANEFSVDRIGLSYDRVGPPPNIGNIERGPAGLRTIQHDLLVSQAIGNKWRVSGVLQHGLLDDGGGFDPTYRAAGGGFVSRVYRPTFQIGAGLISLNVAPWVIPTIRIVHVGQRWRSDVLLPRAETWYDVGHGVEIGGTLRFLANRWNSDDDVPARQFFDDRTTTYRQATLGPALNWKVNRRGLLQVETGVALRRLRYETTTSCAFPACTVLADPLPSGAFRTDVKFDNAPTPFLRASGRLTF